MKRRDVYHKLIFHFVWATKYRTPYLTARVEEVVTLRKSDLPPVKEYIARQKEHHVDMTELIPYFERTELNS